MKKTIKIYFAAIFSLSLLSYLIQRINGAVSSFEWYNNEQNKADLLKTFANSNDDNVISEINHESELNFINVMGLVDTINLNLLGWFILPIVVISLPIVVSKYCATTKDVLITLISTSILLGICYTTVILEWYGSLQDFNFFIIILVFNYIYLPILVIESIWLFYKSLTKNKKKT